MGPQSIVQVTINQNLLCSLWYLTPPSFPFPFPPVRLAAAPVVAAATTSSDIPAGSEDNFWQWLEGAGNLEKYLATVDAAE